MEFWVALFLLLSVLGFCQEGKRTPANRVFSFDFFFPSRIHKFQRGGGVKGKNEGFFSIVFPQSEFPSFFFFSFLYIVSFSYHGTIVAATKSVQ